MTDLKGNSPTEWKRVGRGVKQEELDGEGPYCVHAWSVAQSCPTLCDPMDCSPPGSSVRGDSPGKNTGVGWHALLQGIVPTQGLNPRLLHYQVDLLPLSHLESPQDPTRPHWKLEIFCFLNSSVEKILNNMSDENTDGSTQIYPCIQNIGRRGSQGGREVKEKGETREKEAIPGSHLAQWVSR